MSPDKLTSKISVIPLKLLLYAQDDSAC